MRDEPAGMAGACAAAPDVPDAAPGAGRGEARGHQGSGDGGRDGRARTDRGRRTRARLVAAAREVFADIGYLDAYVDQIVERAGVSHGTFYVYFPSKQAILTEVAFSLTAELFGGEVDDPDRPRTLYERVHRANRRFLGTYRRNARLLQILEQAAMLDANMRVVRRSHRVRFVERATQFVAQLQRDGVARSDLDPRYVASALGSMVDRTAYVCFVLEEPYDFDEMVHTLSMLWVRALGTDAHAVAG